MEKQRMLPGNSDLKDETERMAAMLHGVRRAMAKEKQLRDKLSLARVDQGCIWASSGSSPWICKGTLSLDQNSKSAPKAAVAKSSVSDLRSRAMLPPLATAASNVEKKEVYTDQRPGNASMLTTAVSGPVEAMGRSVPLDQKSRNDGVLSSFLLEGTYDEIAGRARFLEAVQQWRGAAAIASGPMLCVASSTKPLMDQPDPALSIFRQIRLQASARIASEVAAKLTPCARDTVHYSCQFAGVCADSKEHQHAMKRTVQQQTCATNGSDTVKSMARVGGFDGSLSDRCSLVTQAEGEGHDSLEGHQIILCSVKTLSPEYALTASMRLPDAVILSEWG